MIDSTPRFLNGAYAFQGAGYDKPALLDPSLVYVVPADKRAQLIYMRGGNSSGELAYLTLMKDGQSARTFPITSPRATASSRATVRPSRLV